MEQAVQFWRKGQSFSDTTDNVNFDAPGGVNLTHPGWTGIMSNIQSLPQQERIYKRKRMESVFKFLMCPEQKNTMSMKNIVQRSTKPSNQVLDAYARSFSVAKV